MMCECCAGSKGIPSRRTNLGNGCTAPRIACSGAVWSGAIGAYSGNGASPTCATSSAQTGLEKLRPSDALKRFGAERQKKGPGRFPARTLIADYFCGFAGCFAEPFSEDCPRGADRPDEEPPDEPPRDSGAERGTLLGAPRDGSDILGMDGADCGALMGARSICGPRDIPRSTGDDAGLSDILRGCASGCDIRIPSAGRGTERCT